ncbi:MAG: CHAT domain-containing tetratricopeptide repeat protein [Nostoc sp. ChiSLP02]|nr:CHAT domain-containing tetratricopeptide repeat protein [Nostoc sp. DedSLP05]MDZ8097541.1 CHAT domain-containing tetratricopeptide repeat protein [Nostoc sp. DedSLP01]MDZ8189794.1 CHAT domain-containing tetratricopeptide repeat protein [Nostoc sp. ChiSLP02]
MNEQRLQAYYQLIQNLLSCPSGEEPEILAANTELLDADFVQVVAAVADDFAQQGEENAANWLRNLATQLTPQTTPITQENIETYGQFLLEILQATVDSNGDAQVIYPLLAANTDKLNDIFAQLLGRWAKNTLAKVEPDAATSIAAVIGNFSNLIQQFPLGSKASNMEIAIVGYEIALTVYTKSAFPVDWATTQNNLGNAYADRILGNKAENIENAIAAFTAALEVRTKSAFSVNWATTQNNLGNAYRNTILGNRAENLESAIAAYTAALEVYTKSAFPEQWATTQNNLGLAYTDRILGNRAENLENAIAAFTAALEVRTRSAFPVDWATTQNNLAIAYINRILGAQAENIEKAIAAFSRALNVYTRTAFPQNWATTLINLGNAYLKRILGDKTGNIEQAITNYSSALEILTYNAFPLDWATTQNNLGNAYLDRIKDDRANNIEQAIVAYTAVLTVYTRSAFPLDWATTQNNLGTAYSRRIEGNRTENLEKAIAAYRAALEVYTPSAFPQDWATTQNNLGIAYSNRILGERADNLERAIAAYTAALKVYTRSAFPLDWATTLINLGNAYLDRILGDKAENIEQAIAAYTTAQEVYTQNAFPKQWATTQNNLEIAYGYRVTDKIESREQKIAVYISRTEALFNIGNTYQNVAEFDLAYTTYESAIITFEYVRESLIDDEVIKRNLSENWSKLYQNMVEVCLHQGEYTKAIEYIERSKTRNLVELLAKATLTSPENSRLVGSRIEFSEIQNLLDNKTAIIQWYIFNDCFRAFIMSHENNKPAIWHSSEQDLDALIDWRDEYLRDYYNPEDQNKIQWQNQLEQRLKNLAEILHLEEVLDLVPKQRKRLILIPHRYLHLFPLHALPVKESYLIDLFPNGVGYAPSCQLLQQIQLRQRPDFQSFFAIQNPTKDLYQDYEKDLGAVAAIKKQFTERQILKQDEAKKSAILCINENPDNVMLYEKLLKANCAFFFCHGYFNFASPQDSGLKLADGNLTLADIITHFKLENCRLVTLSACETGLTDFTSTSDEYIGLPSGFLLAGSTNVVSSLWTVSATATALLMIKFYEELQQEINIVLALNTAQRWLRDTTVKGFQDWLSNSSLSLVWQAQLNQYFAANYENTSIKPFESPFYWAAFCNIGKGV